VEVPAKPIVLPLFLLPALVQCLLQLQVPVAVHQPRISFLQAEPLKSVQLQVLAVATVDPTLTMVVAAADLLELVVLTADLPVPAQSAI
jgi:hypothetical protein